MLACKSNFPRHSVPCFQHIHQCPTRLTPPENMSHPVFYVWKNLVWSALVPVLCTRDQVRHMHSATRKGLSAAPVLCMEGKGQCSSRAALPRGRPLLPASQQHRPPGTQQEGHPSLTLPFPPEPRQSSPSGLTCTPLSLRRS